MTCKPILIFLEENGIEPTKENKKRWQAGWTLSEIRQWYENVLNDYKKSIENEFGENFITNKEKEKQKKNEEKIQKAIKKEKERREFEQFTKLEVWINYYWQLFIVNFLYDEK